MLNLANSKSVNYDCKDFPEIICGVDISRNIYRWFNGKCQFDAWNSKDKESELILN